MRSICALLAVSVLLTACAPAPWLSEVRAGDYVLSPQYGAYRVLRADSLVSLSPLYGPQGRRILGREELLQLRDYLPDALVRQPAGDTAQFEVVFQGMGGPYRFAAQSSAEFSRVRERCWWRGRVSCTPAWIVRPAP